MKSWFPSDHLQWQRAARLALDMQESDPPIDVAFPNLAASRSGHSRTGTGRLEGAGSGPRLRWDSSSRAYQAQPISLPSLAVPDLRPKFWRKAAIPLVIVLALLAGGAGIFLFTIGSQPPVLPPEVKSITPVRPMVETPARRRRRA
jgi:hypothetical protein